MTDKEDEYMEDLVIMSVVHKGADEVAVIVLSTRCRCTPYYTCALHSVCTVLNKKNQIQQIAILLREFVWSTGHFAT